MVRAELGLNAKLKLCRLQLTDERASCHREERNGAGSLSFLPPFPPHAVCPPEEPQCSGQGSLGEASWERGGSAQPGGFFIWEHAYFLIGLGVNEWIRSVWIEQAGRWSV